MKETSLPEFSDDTQIWIYGADRLLTDDELAIVQRNIQSFLTSWQSHGAPVRGAFQIRDKRFLILAGECPGGISGCSIDSSVKGVATTFRELGIDVLDRSRIYFRDPDGSAQCVGFLDFQRMVDDGTVGAATPVFDTTLTRLSELREGLFQQPLERSWHARSFTVPETA